VIGCTITVCNAVAEAAWRPVKKHGPFLNGDHDETVLNQSCTIRGISETNR